MKSQNKLKIISKEIEKTSWQEIKKILFENV